MKVDIHPKFKRSAGIVEAESIIRSCVHCGFCNATCPTYQEVQDERDGPRGRIYLIKQFLEEGEASLLTRRHLDRCLQCLSCQTTCPSGVQYGRLYDIARDLLDVTTPRTGPARLKRWLLARILPVPMIFDNLVAVGQFFRPLLPTALKTKIPPRQRVVENDHTRGVRHAMPTRRRKMLLLNSCAQSSAIPNTNRAAIRVLGKLGIVLSPVSQAGCCGGVSFHGGDSAAGLNYMRRNIDAWWPAIEGGAEAIVITASGCGVMVKDYGHLLQHDPAYAERAERVSQMCKDISEVLAEEDLSGLAVRADNRTVALHIPCTLQHGLGLPDTVGELLRNLGFDVVEPDESHLCCGSAGTYSLLQPELSGRLLERKLDKLVASNPDLIASANVGCQMHLQSKSTVPVVHWVELLD